MGNPSLEQDNNIKNSDGFAQKTRSFFKTHFPHDRKSYAMRMAIVGLVLSLTALQITLNFKWTLWNIILSKRDIAIWALVVIFVSVNYGLYQGIESDDRKQFTSWIIIKIVEIVVCLITLGNAIGNHYERRYSLGGIIFGFAVVAMDLGQLIMIWKMGNRTDNDLDT